MIVKSQFKAWKWKFRKGHTYALPFSIPGSDSLTILSNSGNPLVIAKHDKLSIKRHYHFDGATWAPDFDRVLSASALHDALLQLSAKYPAKVSEEMAHKAFRAQMRRDGFLLWPLYYWAVSSFPRRIYKLLTKGDK